MTTTTTAQVAAKIDRLKAEALLAKYGFASPVHLWADQVMAAHGADGWWDAVLASAPILDADVTLIDRAMDAESDAEMPTPSEAGCDYADCQSLDDMRRCLLMSVLSRAEERLRPIEAWAV